MTVLEEWTVAQLAQAFMEEDEPMTLLSDEEVCKRVDLVAAELQKDEMHPSPESTQALHELAANGLVALNMIARALVAIAQKYTDQLKTPV